MIDKKLNKDYISYDAQNNQIVASYEDDTIYKVRSARGYYGITDQNNHEIIYPVWNSIDILSKDRFIVGKVADSASTSVGIIDDNENIIVPLIFNCIYQENDYFRIGILNENGKAILFDRLGNIAIPQEWDSYEVQDNVIKVKKDTTTAVLSADSNGECKYSSIYFPSNIFDKQFSVTIKNPISDGTSTYEDYSIIVNKFATYCEAIFNCDTDQIRSITNSQYYNSLISNMLPDCNLSHISNVDIFPERSKEHSNAIVYHANVKLTYTSNSTILKETTIQDEQSSQAMTTAQLNTTFIRSNDGELVMMSAEKTIDEPTSEELLDVTTEYTY